MVTLKSTYWCDHRGLYTIHGNMRGHMIGNMDGNRYWHDNTYVDVHGNIHGHGNVFLATCTDTFSATCVSKDSSCRLTMPCKRPKARSADERASTRRCFLLLTARGLPRRVSGSPAATTAAGERRLSGQRVLHKRTNLRRARACPNQQARLPGSMTGQHFNRKAYSQTILIWRLEDSY